MSNKNKMTLVETH